MREPIRNPYSRAFWICLTLGIALLAAGLGLVALLSLRDFSPEVREGLTASAIFSAVIALILLVVAFFFGLMMRGVKRFIDLIRSEQYLVRWSYLPDEWQAFQEAEAPLLQRDFRRLVVFPLLIGLPLVVVLMFFMFSQEDRDNGAPLFVGVLTGGILALLVGGAYYFRVVRRRSWGRKQRLAPPDSYLHREFVHANGEFLLFGMFNQELIDVQLLPGAPAMIEFTIRSYAPRGGETLETYRVLVPGGQRERAGEVVNEIRSAWRLGST